MRCRRERLASVIQGAVSTTPTDMVIGAQPQTQRPNLAMKLPQLSLRDLFWLVLVAACLSGWWVERSRLRAEIDSLRKTPDLDYGFAKEPFPDNIP